MIRKVVLRRFKRFADETFEFPGHIVLAGPNNTGKTTVLQAIAAWDLALNRWRELNRFQKYKGSYSKAPVARQAFAAVPLRTFDLLWHERSYRKREPIEIEIYGDEPGAQAWRLAMELTPDSTEQIYVRPKGDVDPEVARNAKLLTVYIPPMTGLSTEEPVYQPPKQQQLLGQGKPGDIIRNILVEAHHSAVWDKLQQTMRELFNCEVIPPDASGAHIIAEYQPLGGSNGHRFDIASAGSGFQQVLMLLTFLYTHPASVLLLDEPDAHLHIILQDAIYGKLRAVAAEQKSQLIMATHSEVIIDTVEPQELCMLLDHPRLLSAEAERNRLIEALRFLSNSDIVLALSTPGVLYAEGHTDIDILKEWARVLNHRLFEMFSARLFWKPKVINERPGARGCEARDHYEILKLVKPDIRGIELVDGDDQKGKGTTPFEPGKLQRLRWQRYEVESYLVHPTAIDRYIEAKVGQGEASELNRQDARAYFEEQLPSVLRNPLGDHLILNGVKASEEIIPKILAAAGIHGVAKRDFYEIAALMRPEEIHPEVIEKLDAIAQAFGL